MLNFYNKNKQIGEKKDQIFEGIFDMFKKNPPQIPAEPEKIGLVKRVGPNSYMFGENLVKSTNYPPHDILKFDWEKSQLNWIFKSKFTANKMNFDLKNQIITDFEGNWDMGSFKGRTFTGVFAGTLFQGGFIGNNKDFQTNPVNFLGGKFSAIDKAGILGIPNIIQKKSRQKTINLVAIPEKYTLKIISIKGVESFITVNKRLNYLSDDFQYSVFNGYNPKNSIASINIPWSAIRQIFNTNKIKITIGETINIADILEIPDGISNLEIIPEDKPIIYPKSFINKELTFDLTKLPLGIQSLPSENPELPRSSKISIFLPDLGYADGFNKVMKNLSNFSFKGDLTRIKDGVENGLINGYGDFYNLKALFNNVKGGMNGIKYEIKKKPEKEPEIPYGDQALYDAMKRLDEFMQNFVNRIVIPGTENQDIIAKEYIIEKLREILSINKFIDIHKPGKGSFGQKSNPEGEKASFIKKLPTESIRKLTRKIIDDNF